MMIQAVFRFGLVALLMALHGALAWAQPVTYLGIAIALSAFTLIPYALVLLQLRVFYARDEPWTPILIIVAITIVKIAGSLAAPRLTDDPDRLFDESRDFLCAQPAMTLPEHYRAYFRWIARQCGKTM